MKKHRLFFSLIELLIVVAIISILASLLLPALKSARDKAHAITCLSNMKQVGFGSAQYTGDNDDWLVPNWNGKDPSEYDGDRYERHWYGLFAACTRIPRIWSSPGIRPVHTDSPGGSRESPSRSAKDSFPVRRNRNCSTGPDT